jgi:hypothetical protein
MWKTSCSFLLPIVLQLLDELYDYEYYTEINSILSKYREFAQILPGVFYLTMIAQICVSNQNNGSKSK